MGQLRQKGGRICPLIGKLRVEGKGQDGVKKVKDGDRPANKPTWGAEFEIKARGWGDARRSYKIVKSLNPKLWFLTPITNKNRSSPKTWNKNNSCGRGLL